MSGHKIKRSLAAMGWGWVACNLSLWLWIVLTGGYASPRQVNSLLTLTGLVILAAWLLIFLPTDLLVPETSPLRRPWAAAGCGAVAGFLPLFLIQLFATLTLSRPFDGAELLANVFGRELRPYLIGSVVAGFTAALALVLRHPRRLL